MYLFSFSTHFNYSQLVWVKMKGQYLQAPEIDLRLVAFPDATEAMISLSVHIKKPLKGEEG